MLPGLFAGDLLAFDGSAGCSGKVAGMRRAVRRPLRLGV